MGAQNGSIVVLHFRLELGDGTEVDATTPDEPFTVVLGQGSLLSSLEQHLLGVDAGDRKRILIPAADAYGELETGPIERLPRGDFPGEAELAPGLVLAFSLPNGEEVPGTVLAVESDEVIVDFTHPLAGHDLVFDVEIVSVTNAS